MKTLILSCCFFTNLSLSVLGVEEQKQDALTAKQIFDQVAKRYANCKTYYDTGVVKTIRTREDGSKSEIRSTFVTAFVRPDRFRVEYHWQFDEHAGGRLIVWRDGQNIQVWCGEDEPSRLKGAEQSLNSALVATTGITSGLGRTIPALLLPGEISGRALTDMTDEKRISDESFAGVDCFRIEGFRGKTPTIVWIDKKTFLVRRIYSKFSLEVETTITYDPVTNGEIPPKMLEFNPPKESE